jgi:dephospho-CoA kinase
VRAAVIARWGEAMAPDGVIDRGAIATKAFAAPEEREWLEGLIWPKVGERIAEWRAVESQKDPAALVVEVPLLFEAGMEAAFDATIAVVAAEEVRRERADARGHASLSERTARQLSQEEKAARATYPVHNSGTIQELEQALRQVLEELRA